MADVNAGEMLRLAGIDSGDARVLLCAALGIDDARLAAHPEQPLTDEQRRRYLELVARRRTGEPVAYLTGEREFFSLAFKVTPAVLIPRPETELLVETALARIPADTECRVLELATGSGCVAVAIGLNRSHARLTATDASRDALAVARENAARHRARVEFIESDWFAALAGRRFDVIVANPPYVAEGDPHLAQGDLRFEPRAALVGGRNGLDCIRLIVARACTHLEPGGRLLFEHGYDQAGRCRGLLEAVGYREVTSHRDLAGVERVSEGCI